MLHIYFSEYIYIIRGNIQSYELRITLWSRLAIMLPCYVFIRGSQSRHSSISAEINFTQNNFSSTSANRLVFNIWLSGVILVYNDLEHHLAVVLRCASVVGIAYILLASPSI